MGDNNEGQGRWAPFYEPAPPEWGKHPRKKMLMTPLLVILGGLFAFAVPTLVAAFFQTFFFQPPVSNNWAPIQGNAERGRQLYIANGCLYCHSGYNRPQDVREGLYYLYPRVSLPGDFATSDSGPNNWGTARIGPSLAEESGFHPDDWQFAHFTDPRFVDPLSIMPDFSFLSDQEMRDLTAFVQTQSGKDGLVRYAGQIYMKKLILVNQGLYKPPAPSIAKKMTLKDVAYLQVLGISPPGFPQLAPENDSTVTPGGLGMPDALNLFIVDRGYWLTDNPLPVTKENLARGRMIFQERCIGCHGEGGAAVSLAARFMSPMPLPFDVFDDQRHGNDTSPGDFYYRVLRGINGTAMENFGTRLRVDDIWRVVLFLKTIPNGGLQENRVPTPDMYVQWSPQQADPALLGTFIPSFPDTAQPEYDATATASQVASITGSTLSTAPNNITIAPSTVATDAFYQEAMRCLNGMGPNDSFVLEGFGRVSLLDARNEIKAIYVRLLNEGWADFKKRGGFPVPPPSQKAAAPDQYVEELR